MKPFLSFLVFTFLTAVGLEAYENLENAGPKIWSQPGSWGEDATWVMLEKTGSGMERTTVLRKVIVQPDGTVRVEASGEGIRSLAVFQKNGHLVSADQSSAKKKAHFHIEVNNTRTKAVFQLQEKDKNTTHENPLSGKSLLTMEINTTIAQAWQAGIRDGLSFKSFSPDGANEADMEFKFVETLNPTSLNNKLDYPAEFKAALPATESYVVGEMYLTGIASMFYPHHMYFVYKKAGAKLEMVAYFGGEPAKAEFQYRVK